MAAFKPRRPLPANPAAGGRGELDADTAAFHARAAALARSQAEASGLTSASFPMPIDLNSLRLRSGDALLTAAVKKDTAAGVKLLADAGVELDAQDELRGWTALHHAAHLGRVGCVDALLQAGCFTLIHATDGLLASQLAANPAIKRSIEEREREQDVALMQEVVVANGGAYVGRCAVFEESQSDSFPIHLYRMECAKEISCSDSFETEVFFRGPALRKADDCICLFYVDDVQMPHVIRPRLGSVFYLSEKRNTSGWCVPPSRRLQPSASSSSSSSTSSASAFSSPSAPLSDADVACLGWDSLIVTMNLSTLPMAAYRFLLYDSARDRYMAATDIFSLNMQETPNALGARPTVAATPPPTRSCFSFLSP